MAFSRPLLKALAECKTNQIKMVAAASVGLDRGRLLTLVLLSSSLVPFYKW
jgi:hypothetical protein